MADMSKWQIYWLDPADDEHPPCSHEGCKQPANRIIGHYENDTQQGEHSRFCGWYYCNDHSLKLPPIAGERRR